MTALKNAQHDLKQITTKLTQNHIDTIKNIVDKSQTREELLQNLNTSNSTGQFIMVHLLVNVSEEAGKHRGGNPTLADEILDKQFSKIRQYGNKAYPMSEKQVLVIVNDCWNWLK